MNVLDRILLRLETLGGDRKLPVAEYNAAAAEPAWKPTMEFFTRHLR